MWWRTDIRKKIFKHNSKVVAQFLEDEINRFVDMNSFEIEIKEGPNDSITFYITGNISDENLPTRPQMEKLMVYLKSKEIDFYRWEFDTEKITFSFVYRKNDQKCNLMSLKRLRRMKIKKINENYESSM